MNLLEEYVFVPLDILKEIVHNKEEIGNQLEAWLAFFCMDEPEWILKLSENYPQFREMYEEIYEMCRNLERVMQMYSKELQELDSNTVQYMIDEMQETINQKNNEIKEQASQLSEKDRELKAQAAKLGEKDKELAAQASQLSQKDEKIEEQAVQLSQRDDLIAELQSQIREMQKHLSEQQ